MRLLVQLTRSALWQMTFCRLTYLQCPVNSPWNVGERLESLQIYIKYKTAEMWVCLHLRHRILRVNKSIRST